MNVSSGKKRNQNFAKDDTRPIEFDTSCEQVLDSIGNRFQIADYKTGLVMFSGVGGGSSTAANNDFCAGVISVKPDSVFPSVVCTVC